MYNNIAIKTLVHSLGTDYHIKTHKGYVTIYRNINEDSSIKIMNIDNEKCIADVWLSCRLQEHADLIHYIRFHISFCDIKKIEEELITNYIKTI